MMGLLEENIQSQGNYQDLANKMIQTRRTQRFNKTKTTIKMPSAESISDMIEYTKLNTTTKKAPQIYESPSLRDRKQKEIESSHSAMPEGTIAG